MCRSKTKAIFNLYFVNAILKALWASSEYCKSDLLAILQYTHILIIIGKMQVFHYFIRQLLKCFPTLCFLQFTLRDVFQSQYHSTNSNPCFKYCLLKARQRGAIYQLKGKIVSVEISKWQLSMTLQSIVSVLVENPSLTGCSYKMFANPDGKAS